MSHMLKAARGYAGIGWHVFPVHGIVAGRCTCGPRDCSSPGKHPLTRHGLKDATTDEDVIRAWWGRWPHANIAVATGQRSGIAVIDLDLPRALGSLDCIVHKLPSTLTGLTGGGGLHLLYRGRRGQRLRNRASALPGIPNLPGIDLRADGGYIVVPPSLHVSGNRYAWLDPAAHIADAPAWLKEDPRRFMPPMPPSPPKFCTGDGTRYGLAALERALAELRSAPVGTRNHTLNRVAFGMARLVTAGHLAEHAVRSALMSAGVSIGLTARETEGTVASAFSAVGLSGPYATPDQDARRRERHTHDDRHW